MMASGEKGGILPIDGHCYIEDTRDEGFFRRYFAAYARAGISRGLVDELKKRHGGWGANYAASPPAANTPHLH